MMDLTPALVRAARELLGWNVERLASEAGVSASTINRFQYARDETAIGISFANVQRIRRALEAGGIRFTSDTEGIGLSLARHPLTPPNRD